MFIISRQFSMTAKHSFAVGLLVLLASSSASAQGVAFAGDYETASPAADESGPKLPALRGPSTPHAIGGMQQRTSRPSRGQAAPQTVPREMLAAPTEPTGEAESSSGLRSKFGRFSLSGIFGDDASEQSASGTRSAKHPGPRRMQRRSTPVPQSGAEALAPTEKSSRFSLRKLFGGADEEAMPPADQAAPMGRPYNFQPQQTQEPGQFRNDVSRVQQMQLQREQSEISDLQDSAVTPVDYTSRGNSGLQLRPATNRPASLLGGNPNNSMQANRGANSFPTQPRNSFSRVPQGVENNAFDRGRETMERLRQPGGDPVASGPQSQPVFVSDEASSVTTRGASSSPQSSRVPQQKRPLITSMSPEMPHQSPQASMPMSPSPTVQSRVIQSEPAPLVIENRAATASQQPTAVAKNPVPLRAEAVQAAPTAQPSERVVQLLAEANGFAQTAESEEQLTQVVQMCRHALAIDSSAQAVEYSKNLAGWALNRRGELRADAGRDRDAMLDFEDAIHTNPDLWRAVHNRGVMLAQQGQFAAAFDEFNRTVELNPKFAKAYSNRAALYTQAGDLGAALDDYRQAITLDPDLAVAHKGRGRVCHMVGNFEEALQHYDAAVLLASGDAHMALGRADLLTDMGRYAAAIEGYQQTIAMDPSLEAAYRSLAWVQATCPDESFRNAEQALAHAEQALQRAGQEDDLTLDTLAAAQANAGDFAGAQATQARAIELAPAADRALYQDRLGLYQSNQPFRTEPPQPIRQATYQR